MSRQPTHGDILHQLGSIQADVKATHRAVEKLEQQLSQADAEQKERLNQHSRRLGSLERWRAGVHACVVLTATVGAGITTYLRGWFNGS